MIEWLEAKSSLDVATFYDLKYARSGLDAFSGNRWDGFVETIQLFGGPFAAEKRLIEAGCGTGKFLEAIWDRVSCTGFDISREAIRLAEKRLSGKAFVFDWDVMEDAYWSDSRYDYVVSFGTIEHSMDPLVALRNLLQMAKPGCPVLVTVPLEFQDCLEPIRNEPLRSTNERFASHDEWFRYFSNVQPPDMMSIVGEGERKDVCFVFRKKEE